MSFDFSAAALDHEFPVRRNLVYFNHATVAALPRRVAEAVIAQTRNMAERGGADWRDWFALHDATRAKIAAFLQAKPGEIAFAPSTSWGLNLIAQAVDWQPGDNVVGDDMEFPANIHPWLNLARRGVELRLAKSRDGRITLDDIAAKVDARTRLVTVSWVAFHNGWVYPIDEIGTFCRERGILFVLDAIQGLGALPLDLSRTPVDVVVADGHKWLLAPEACAVLYVNEAAQARLAPPAAGWWNVKHGGSFRDYRLHWSDGARRYEPGTLPTAQIAGLKAAIELFDEIGMDVVQQRIQAVIARLREMLLRQGWHIVSPKPLRSGILAAAPPSGDARYWARALEQRGIIAVPREGALRFSPHCYNDAGEVARIEQALTELGV